MKKNNILKYSIVITLLLSSIKMFSMTANTIYLCNECSNQWGEICVYSLSTSRYGFEGAAKCTNGTPHNICSQSMGDEYISQENAFFNALDYVVIIYSICNK